MIKTIQVYTVSTGPKYVKNRRINMILEKRESYPSSKNWAPQDEFQ